MNHAGAPHRSHASVSPLRRRGLIGLAALLAVGCPFGGDGSGDSLKPPPERLVDSLVEDVIVAGHADLQFGAEGLVAAAENLCDSPPAGLPMVRIAWAAARAPLKRSEAWWFGPIVDDGIVASLDSWPVQASVIEESIAKGNEPTQQWVGLQPDAAQGLPAIEYLVYDPEGGDEVIEQSLDPGTEEGAHRCSYILGAARRAAARASALNQAWHPSGGDYGSPLFAEGQSRKSMRRILQTAVDSLYRLTDVKIGVPLGDADGGEPQPTRVESRFSDNTAADLRSNIEGVERIWFGGGDASSVGLTDMVEPDDPALDESVRDAFDAAKAAVDAMGSPMRLAIVDDPASVEAVRTAVIELRSLLEDDVAVLLDLEIEIPE